MKKLTLTATIATIAMVAAMPAVKADTTVHTKTYVEAQNIEGVSQINFSAFDVNNDGLYAKSEVGSKLFDVFDNDGNDLIDNIEWDERSVYTITPMEKQTFQFVDYNDDGSTDLSSYTYETFYQESGLIRFDKNKNGLSPAEFIGESFQSLDDNDDNMIDLEEWQEAYTVSTRPATAEPERYN